jgi:TonB family protein
VRFSPQEKALLISAGFHGAILLALGLHSLYVTRRPDPPPGGQEVVRLDEPGRHVWLPPREVLRQLLPQPAVAVAPRPQPVTRNRISIGPPSEQRAREILLRREDDLTAAPKGRPGAGPAAETPSREGAEPSTPTEGGASAPASPGPSARSARGFYGPAAGVRQPSIAEAVRRLGAQLGGGEGPGLPSGKGRQIGPLFFDPAGADFTAWVNHFKNEIYRNWFLPQSVFLGARGRVEIVFVADRSGRLTDVKVLESSGTAALDRAAANALVGSHFLPLPADYSASEVTMRISFLYSRGPES